MNETNHNQSQTSRTPIRQAKIRAQKALATNVKNQTKGTTDSDAGNDANKLTSDNASQDGQKHSKSKFGKHVLLVHMISVANLTQPTFLILTDNNNNNNMPTEAAPSAASNNGGGPSNQPEASPKNPKQSTSKAPSTSQAEQTTASTTDPTDKNGTSSNKSKKSPSTEAPSEPQANQTTPSKTTSTEPHGASSSNPEKSASTETPTAPATNPTTTSTATSTESHGPTTSDGTTSDGKIRNNVQEADGSGKWSHIDTILFIYLHYLTNINTANLNERVDNSNDAIRKSKAVTENDHTPTKKSGGAATETIKSPLLSPRKTFSTVRSTQFEMSPLMIPCLAGFSPTNIPGAVANSNCSTPDVGLARTLINVSLKGDELNDTDMHMFFARKLPIKDWNEATDRKSVVEKTGGKVKEWVSPIC